MLRMKFFAAALSVATSMAMMGGTSEAASLNPSNDIVSGGSYDILGGPYAFGVFFTDADPATVYSFDFFNSSATTATFGVSVGTLLQFASKFFGGVTVAWGTGDSVFLAQASGGAADPSRTQGFSIFTNLSAGETDTLTLTFGDPQAPGKGQPGLQMNVAAVVPLPAGGLLLLGALGGIAALRRRKSV